MNECCSASSGPMEDQSIPLNTSETFQSADVEAVADTEEKFVDTLFQEGPLGVNIRRRPDDGIVVVYDIIAETQAVELDVEIGDELWSVGGNVLGDKYLEKDSWHGLVEYIKASARPLQITWKRRRFDERNPQNLIVEDDLGDSPTISTKVQNPENADTLTVADENYNEDSMEDLVNTSPEYLALKDALSKLVKKSSRKDQFETFPHGSLLKKDGRRILKRGDVHTPGAAMMWTKTYKRCHVLLLSDLLIITTPVEVTLSKSPSPSPSPPSSPSAEVYYQVDHIIDLQVCKLRSNGHSFGLGIDSVEGSKFGGGGPGLLGGGGGVAGAAAANAVAVMSSWGAAVGGALQSNSNSSSSSGGDKANGTIGARTSSSSGISTAAVSESPETVFQVIYPGATLQLIADSKEEKEVWVLNLFIAICAQVEGEGGEGRRLGWQHQYMLGTMHSAVLSHDEMQVRDLIQLCDSGQMEFATCIDAVDEDGYTPLHYACMLRMHGIIRALHEAAADVTATDRDGLTPLHWAAMQLDAFSLELLCSHVFDLDFYDKQQRTPLFMACVEGRDMKGHTDVVLLRNCVSTMLRLHPDVNLRDTQTGYTILHYLAGSWQYETIEVLDEAGGLEVNARSGLEVNARSGEQQDDCTGMTPLHVACLASPLKRAEGEGMRILHSKEANPRSEKNNDNNDNNNNDDSNNNGHAGNVNKNQNAAPLMEKLNHPYGSTTLRALLKAGARPNMKDARGRTALHILAEPGRDDLWDLMELTDGVAVLVSFGARFDDSSPALVSLKDRLLGVDVDALIDRWNSLPVINGDSLNLTINHFQPLDAADVPVDSPAGAGVAPSTNSGKNAGKRGSGGGSFASQLDGEDRCALCSAQYGLFKRPHHCRLCSACCCDDCSRKRCIIEGAQVRSCDSCYNQVMHLQEQRNHQEMLIRKQKQQEAAAEAKLQQEKEQQRQVQQQKKSLSSAAGTAATTASADTENRTKLFRGGSSNNSAATGSGSGNVNSYQTTSEGRMNQTMGVLNETHEKLQERGEKLSRVQERSEEMANQANEFAKMAKLLNQQQKNRWF